MSLQTVKPQLKYGLIKKAAPVPSKKLVASAAFRADLDDDNDDDDGNEGESFDSKANIKRVNKHLSDIGSRINVDTTKLYEEALSTDASVFDYDGSYDSFKAAEKTMAQHSISKAAAQPKAKYVENLQAMAKVREKEKDRIFERKLLKEREAEDKEFPDQPQFVTAAYKAKLLESKKWNYEDRLSEEIEKRTDVRGSGMAGFYSNMLTKNIAFGGDVSNATSAYTTGSGRQQALLSASIDETAPRGSDSSHPESQAERSSIEEPDDSERTSQLSRENDLEAVSISKKRALEETSSTDINSTQLASEEIISPVIHKEDKILSARERYLARKKLAPS